MNLDKFTIKAQEAIQQAQQIAMASEHQSIETQHILKGVLEVDENVIPFLFKKAGVSADKVTTAVDELIRSCPKVSGSRQYLSDDANKAVQKALSHAQSLSDEFVSIEHLLLGMLEGKD
ncbi:MAG: Clp protease N-terminal domain-containing protein, partial [Bacteroidota bacterium]